MNPTRRTLIGGAAAALLAPRGAAAFGATSAVDIAEIDLGPGTVARLGAWSRLLREVQQATSIEVGPAARIRLDDDALFAHPLSVICGDGAFELPSEAALERLSRYLTYGGLLLIDDTASDEGGGFDRSARRLCERIFPTHALAALPSDHSLYRSFFLIDRPVGRTARARWLDGVTVGGREGLGGYTPIVFCHDDLSGALNRGDDGSQRPCEPGGESQRREAVKLAVNLVLYCVTTDYKKDQAHVNELLRRNALRGDWR